MGFIRAFVGSLQGTFADQWKDYIMPRADLSATTGLIEGVPKVKSLGSKHIITDGSRILVPEGMALVMMQDGGITGYIDQAGGYTYSTKELNSQSFFNSNTTLATTLATSIERFKFNGTPGVSQQVFYINLKEIPNNRFGTQSQIFFDDAFLNTQVGATTRGTYSIQIKDPILFVKEFVPAQYLAKNAPAFDFADTNNQAASQMFNEVVASLAGAFATYVNQDDKQNRISNIQRDTFGFAKALAIAIEQQYQWQSKRGLEITNVAIVAIEYDKNTQQLLSEVQRADALMGARGNSNLQAATARGIEAAGQNGGSGLAFMGMGVNAVGGINQSMQQESTELSFEEKTSRLREMKALLDEGIITQEEFDNYKKDVLK